MKMSHKKTATVVLICGLGLATATSIWFTRGWSGRIEEREDIAGGIQFYRGTYEKRGEESVEIYAAVIDPDQSQFSIVSQSSEGIESAQDFIAFAERYDALVMINGGYFDHNFVPVGLAIQGGTEVAGVLEQRPLSAAVITYKSGSIAVVPTEDYSPSPDQIHAFQAGPYLIDPGGEPGIYSEDYKRAERSAIGLTDEGVIVLLTTSPCTLFQLSEILSTDPQAIGVNAFEYVLNLDGGPSSGLYFQTQPSLTRPSEDAVQNAIVVRAK